MKQKSISQAREYAKENNFEVAITKDEVLAYKTNNSERFTERDLKELQELFDTNVYIEQDQEVVLDILNSYFKFYHNNPNFKKIPLVIYQNTKKRGFGEGEDIEYDFLHNIFIFSNKKGYYDIIKSNTEPINGTCGFVYEKYKDKLIGAFMHEYGHYINSNNVPYIDSKWHTDNWIEIGKHISLYAQENRAEYLAEVFTLKNAPDFSELDIETRSFIKNNYDDKIPKDKVKFNGGGSIKSKGTFNPLGSAKELGVTPKIEGHDMIAKCDCGEKFSYQNSKKNILWQCPECNGMKRITTS